jgi:hypothetical protein
MNLEETQELQAHLKPAAAILFKHTPPKQLKDFESLEMTLRDHLLERVNPEIGNFFAQCHRDNIRQSPDDLE